VEFHHACTLPSRLQLSIFLIRSIKYLAVILTYFQLIWFIRSPPAFKPFIYRQLWTLSLNLAGCCWELLDIYFLGPRHHEFKHNLAHIHSRIFNHSTWQLSLELT
jgi:hypothetical protein